MAKSSGASRWRKYKQKIPTASKKIPKKGIHIPDHVPRAEAPDAREVLHHWARSVASHIHKSLSKNESQGWEGDTQVEYRLEYQDYLVVMRLRCEKCNISLTRRTVVTEDRVKHPEFLKTSGVGAAMSLVGDIRRHRAGCSALDESKERMRAILEKQKKQEQEFKEKFEGKWKSHTGTVIETRDVPEEEVVDDKYPEW